MSNDETIGEWQKKLESTFRDSSGVVGGRLSSVLNSEKAHAALVPASYAGFTTLMDSFQDFFIQTYEETAVQANTKNVHVWALMVASFRRLRCAMVGLVHGYPYDAGASIRALFENAFFYSAVLHGVAAYDDLFSFASQIDYHTDTPSAISKKQRRHLQALDQTVKSFIWGDQSGLSATHQDEIGQLLTLLHSHVHRAESTIVELSLDMANHKRLPSLGPTFDERAANRFATPTVYATWMLHRLIPFMGDPTALSAEWSAKWQVLDEAFRFYVIKTQGSTCEAICQLVDTRFTFDAEEAYSRVQVSPDVNPSNANN